MNRKGVTLVAVVFIILALTMLVISLSSLFFSGSSLAVRGYSSLRTFYIANAGQEYYLKLLGEDQDWSTPPSSETKAFNGGFFSIGTSSASKDSIVVTVTGVLTTEGIAYIRVIRPTINRTGGGGLPFNFDYAQYSGSGGGATLIISGNARIYGDYYYNGPISMRNSAQQLDGTIYSTSIALSGTAGYASWEASPPIDLPTWDNSHYDGILALTNVSAGSSLNLGWGDILNLNGNTLYYRNVTIGSGATVNGPGTLVSTGKPSGNGDIIINYGAGIGGGIRFVANRYFTCQGGSSITVSFEAYSKSGTRIYNGLTVPSGSILYSSYNGNRALNLQGNITATMLAPYGRINTSGGWTIRGLLYCTRLVPGSSGTIRGAIVSQTTSTLGGSLALYYDEAYLPTLVIGLGGSGTGEGGVGSWEAADWLEIY
ncbi:MAG: hypothetical protein ABIH56_07745 [Candidatus Margulisiibacteriota bacterium]